ncbi:MAG: ABC transporter substrate-binding protein [Advenella sp.]
MKSKLHKKKWLPLLQTALVITFATAAGHGMAQDASIKVHHAKGEATLQIQPTKTAVFDLPTLDNMQALGIQASAVANSRFPDFLAAYNEESIPRVGSLFEPNHEALGKVAPDLIFVGGRSSAKFDDVLKIAPTLDMSVDSQSPLKSIERNVNTLGKLFGKEPQATAALQKLNASVDALKAKSAKAGNAMLILSIGDKASAFGPGSRFGLIYDVFGFTPNSAVKDLSTTDRHPFKLEDIAKADPDWLFVIDRHAATGSNTDKPSSKEVLEKSIIGQTRAAKNNQIVYVDPYNWYILGSAGLTSMQQNIEQISAALDAKK